MAYLKKIYFTSDESGNLKIGKTVVTETFKTVKAQKEASRKRKKEIKEKKLFKESLNKIQDKITGPHEYNKETMWKDFVIIAHRIYYAGYWPDFVEDIYLIGHLLDQKYYIDLNKNNNRRYPKTYQ